MSETLDLAIVGGGVIGTSFAQAASNARLSCALIERFSSSSGSSVRSFGLVWSHIMPDPAWIPHALRARAIYGQLAREFDADFQETGSLLVAGSREESVVLAEFSRRASGWGITNWFLTANEALERQPLLRASDANVRDALFFPEHASIDPRRFIPLWQQWLAQARKIQYLPGRTAVLIDPTGDHLVVRLADGASIHARKVLVATGEEFRTLYPQEFEQRGLKRCKLAMLQTHPIATAPGPAIAFGRSMRHYPLFSHCPSFPAAATQMTDPRLDSLGIHLLVKPCPDGSLVLGDSHQDTGPDAPPGLDYDSAIEELLLGLAKERLSVRSIPIARRWLGYYARHDADSVVFARPQPGVAAITGVTVGMSAGPGLAEAWLPLVMDS